MPTSCPMMQAGKVDKFMSYVKPRLRGSAVHNYRDEARAANNHYDCHTKRPPHHIQQNRLLLRAQPQQGKTGTADEQQLLSQIDSS